MSEHTDERRILDAPSEANRWRSRRPSEANRPPARTPIARPERGRARPLRRTRRRVTIESGRPGGTAMSTESDPSRRDLLRTAAAGLATTLVIAPTSYAADSDRILRENEAPGRRDWMTTNVRVDPKTKYRSPWIEGYASRTSVRPGESIGLHVSTNPASPFVVDVYRMGYHQGLGGRHMARLGPFPGRVQPDPAVGEMRLRECALGAVRDADHSRRLDQRRLSRQAYGRARGVAELHHLGRTRRSQV